MFERISCVFALTILLSIWLISPCVTCAAHGFIRSCCSSCQCVCFPCSFISLGDQLSQLIQRSYFSHCSCEHSSLVTLWTWMETWVEGWRRFKTVHLVSPRLSRSGAVCEFSTRSLWGSDWLSDDLPPPRGSVCRKKSLEKQGFFLVGPGIW